MTNQLQEVFWLVWLMESWSISMPCELCFRVFKLIILLWKAFYRTFGLHRSTISPYHVHVDDKPIGQHPLVCSLLSGTFDSRPPQPKYLFVWNFQEVQNFIKSTWGETDRLEETELSLKLCMLLALHHQGLQGYTIWIWDLWLILVIRSQSISINCMKTWEKGNFNLL